MTKYITNRLGDIIAITDVDFIESNNINSDNRVGVIFIMEIDIVSIIDIGVSSGGNYIISFSIEVGIGSNLGDTVDFLCILSATEIGPAFS